MSLADNIDSGDWSNEMDTHDRPDHCLICGTALADDDGCWRCDADDESHCDRCGEPLELDCGGQSYAKCGDCDGGTSRDPQVGEAWSGGFAPNH